MNSMPTNMAAPAPIGVIPVQEDEGMGLFDLIGVIFDHRKLVLVTALVVTVLGGVYAFLASPVYEANMLIQVEDNKGDPMGNLLGGAGSLFDIKSPTTAEIEILRSRFVVGRAVESLQLDLLATPRYIPLIGRWLARAATSPSEPGFLGFPGYVSGNENIELSYLNVAPQLIEKKYVLRIVTGGWELLDDDQKITAGVVGQAVVFTDEGGHGELLVSSLIGNVGAEFIIQKKSTLAVTEQVQLEMKLAEQGRQSGVIRASYEGVDPAKVARFLNEIGNVYVRQNISRKSEEAEKSLNFLNRQLPELRRALEASEMSFNKFRQEKGTFDLGGEAQQLLEQTVNYQVKLAELQQKKSELEIRFTQVHPSVQAVDSQIKELRQEIATISGKTQVLPKVEQDLVGLTRDVKVNSELYTNLLNSLQQLRLVKEGKVGNVRIVDVAAVPEQPIKPKRAVVVVLSLLLGTLGGVALAFLRHSLNPGIREAYEIEQHLGLGVFANVPHAPAQDELIGAIKARKPGVHLLSVQNPDDPVVESLRSLRTALQFAMLDAPNNLVLVTGPTPGIGKSFVSTNFAAVAAASGKKVLLIDADMRKGYVHQYFGFKRDVGLSNLILGQKSLDEVLRKDVVAGLDFMGTGSLPPNPAELLTLPMVAKIFEELDRRYDLIVIDTPPVLAVADTAIIAPLAGAVFMVVRAEVSTLGEVQESAKRLTQAGVNMRGVIFNDLDVSKRRYGYGYGYGYKYARYRYKQYQYNSTAL